MLLGHPCAHRGPEVQGLLPAVPVAQQRTTTPVSTPAQLYEVALFNNLSVHREVGGYLTSVPQHPRAPQHLCCSLHIATVARGGWAGDGMQDGTGGCDRCLSTSRWEPPFSTQTATRHQKLWHKGTRGAEAGGWSSETLIKVTQSVCSRARTRSFIYWHLL